MALIVYQGQKDLNMNSPIEPDNLASPNGRSGKRFVGLVSCHMHLYLVYGVFVTFYMRIVFIYVSNK